MFGNGDVIRFQLFHLIIFRIFELPAIEFRIFREIERERESVRESEGK